ncbi:MAG: DPP IV N-terminal domain-containing protein, partial [candidate division WOR-3 bacterium]
KFMELAIVNIDGTNFQVLTNDTFPDFAPAISPDGKFIAFESVRERNRDIYIMEIESRKLTRLTEHPADDYSPTWSPDGKRIAFISDRDGHSHIYVINADGTGLFQLTKGEFEVWPGISWSPR